MEVFFINDTSDGTNWGSHAATHSLRNLIVSFGGDISHTKYKKQIRSTQSSNYIHNTSKYAPFLIKKILFSVIEEDFKDVYKLISSVKDNIPLVHSEFDDFAKIVMAGSILSEEVEKIRSSDVVIINGEGLMNKSLSRETRYNLFLAYIAGRYTQTPCYIVNHSIGKGDPQLKKMIEKVYPTLDGVVFREPKSAEICPDTIDNYTVAADTGFSHSIITDENDLKKLIDNQKINILPYPDSSIDVTREYICVAGTSIFQHRSKHNVEGYVRLIKRLKNMSPQVVLVASSNDDSYLYSKILNKTDVPVVSINTPMDISMSILANSSLYIGGRYHPTIFSSKGGVPIIPFSANTYKLEGVFKLLDIDVEVYDSYSIQHKIDEIAEKAETYINNKPKKFNGLDKRASELGLQAELNVSYLDEIDSDHD